MTGEEPSGQTEDVYLQGVVFRDEATGLDEVHVCAGGPDPSRIEDAILVGFADAIGRHLARPEFGGGIRIVILKEITPQTPQLWARVASAEEQLRRIVALRQLRTRSGRPVTIEVNYT